MVDIFSIIQANPWLWFACYIVAGLLGMLVHFLKQDITGNTKADVKAYFSQNFRYTLYALITTVIASIGIYSTGQGIVASFLAGYAFDSILNREAGQSFIKTK